MKVGIPKGLLYYYYSPLWIKFFEGLGTEVVVSNDTNKRIVNNGVTHTVEDACLPVKVYLGHIMDLKDRVDYIFLPRLMSVYKDEYICPKFCGLPELVKSSIHDLPKLIEPTIDFRKSKKNLYKTVHEIGHYITSDTKKIEIAFHQAMESYDEYKKMIHRGILPTDMGKDRLPKHKDMEKIVLLGHPYTVYDPYMSMNIIEKLRDHHLQVLTQDSFDRQSVNEKAMVMDKKIFWSLGRRILGSALYAMEQKDIRGMIYLSAFGCGLDSVIGDIVERRIRRNSNMPYTLLTLDEHTGEAGIETRIEAFVDMIKWRDQHENNLSPYGEYPSIH